MPSMIDRGRVAGNAGVHGVDRRRVVRADETVDVSAARLVLRPRRANVASRAR